MPYMSPEVYLSVLVGNAVGVYNDKSVSIRIPSSLSERDEHGGH